jgi:hypothetical protein
MSKNLLADPEIKQDFRALFVNQAKVCPILGGQEQFSK